MVVGGIVAAVVFQLLLGQGRFAQLQSAREEVQQNARAALEVITAELRAADPRSIAVATPDSIRFRTPRAWGLVCGYPTPDRDRIAVLFPTVALHALRGSDERLAIPPVGGVQEWQFLPVWDRTGTELSTAVGACGALQPEPAIAGGSAAASTARIFAGRGSGGPADALGLTPGQDGLATGTPVYLYDDVKYAVGTQTGVPGAWIRRNTGEALQMQPFAGPVAEPGGLVFEYFDPDGQPIPNLDDPGNQAGRDAIARVRVTVITQSRARFGGAPQRDSASTVVYLRNRH